jgi:hypothetical protein
VLPVIVAALVPLIRMPPAQIVRLFPFKLIVALLVNVRFSELTARGAVSVIGPDRISTLLMLSPRPGIHDVSLLPMYPL